jgi:hypothetical protein
MEQLNQIEEVWKDILWLSLWDLFFLISRFSDYICFSCDTVVKFVVWGDQSGRVCLCLLPPPLQSTINLPVDGRMVLCGAWCVSSKQKR